ncbi:MAG: PLP-dependent lyase/thiolase [Desertimonas sp.]
MTNQPESDVVGVGVGVVGWRCAVCATTLPIAAVHPFRCPRATASDPHHVLHPVGTATIAAPFEHPNPFVRYGPRLAWWGFARSRGMSVDACVALTEDVAAGFTVTPFAPAPALSGALGADVWAKDETANVGGSHKGRHLVTILLHLRAVEALGLAPYGTNRPPLAIASCGNAAIAAATLAAGVVWPLRVFVPEWADQTVVSILDGLGAEITRCARRTDDPPGDPAVLRFREAVAAGALPFGVQGPENALCLDGGRTLGWELADAPVPPRRVVVQVGGGALAACVGWGLGEAVRLDTVQTAGCAPLARAWRRAEGLSDDRLGARWSELMTPWADPHSAADGILDDETYDWIADVEVMRRSGGRPIVVGEAHVLDAHRAAATTGIPVSVTGSAGLAGLLAERPAPDERVAVVFSGVTR